MRCKSRRHFHGKLQPGFNAAKSELPAQHKLREKIITEYVPKTLLDLVGAETILKRVPAPYLDAIVASKVATNYIYRHGMDSNEIDFYNFLKGYLSTSSKIL